MSMGLTRPASLLQPAAIELKGVKPKTQAEEEEANRKKTEKLVNQAVEFLWNKHKSSRLEPDFFLKMHNAYKDEPGWEFVKGPGTPGW
eukprot:gene51868-41282_t